MSFGISNALTLGLGRGRRSASQIITAITAPVLSALEDTDTPADGFTAGSFASSEGTIASTVTTYLVNGSTGASDTDLSDTDTVQVTQLVTDSEGNTRTFYTSTVTVGGVLAAPTASGGLLDQTYAQGEAGTYDVSGDFTGSALTYSVSGAGSSVDAAGVVTTPTASLLSSTAVVVTATNAAGSADSAFSVAVIEAAATLAAEWTIDATTADTSDANFDYYRISTPGDYTLTVTTAGYLSVHARGQGGPGGGTNFKNGGGGGGGNVVDDVIYLAVGDYTVTVPDDNVPGTGGSTAGVKGSDTVIATLSAEAGGIGSMGTNSVGGSSGRAGDGASGGGQASGEGIGHAQGQGDPGFDGGRNDAGSSSRTASGGGGLGGEGVEGSASTSGSSGTGGEPVIDTFFGVPESVGAGGSGGASHTATLAATQTNAGAGGFAVDGGDAPDGFAGGGGGAGNGGAGKVGGYGAAGLVGIRVPKSESWLITEAAGVSDPDFH
ncbi:MAG: glycine-rich domain-containing protein, partial [Paracoccaceae bacterium]